MYAVVSTGGKQYRVEPGATLSVEKLAVEPGATVTFDRVLLVGDGDETTVGTPTVADATVSATVLGEELGPKIVIFKFKQKVKYRRHTGHRQHLTRVRVDEISVGGQSARPDAAKPADEAKDAGEAKPARKATTTRRSRTKASADAEGASADEPTAKADAPKRTAARRPSTRAKRTSEE